MSEKIPKIDVPALKPFLLSALRLNRREFTESESGISFKTPDAWMTTPAMRSKYSDVIIQRESDKKIPSDRVLGVGHVVIDEALRQATRLTASVAGITSKVLQHPIIVFRIIDKVTTQSSNVRSSIVAIEFETGSSPRVLRDWELIQKLNHLLEKRTLARDAAVERSVDSEVSEELESKGRELVRSQIHDLDLPFGVPDVQLLAMLHPASIDTMTVAVDG
jgi:hypothetical protein